jgi:hypothetical protein
MKGRSKEKRQRHPLETDTFCTNAEFPLMRIDDGGRRTPRNSWFPGIYRYPLLNHLSFMILPPVFHALISDVLLKHLGGSHRTDLFTWCRCLSCGAPGAATTGFACELLIVLTIALKKIPLVWLSSVVRGKQICKGRG